MHRGQRHRSLIAQVASLVARRKSVRRLLVVTVPTLGFGSYDINLRAAFAQRDDVESVHVTLTAPLVQKVIMRQYPHEPQILSSALRRRLVWQARRRALLAVIRETDIDAIHFAPQFLGPLMMAVSRQAGVQFTVGIDVTTALTNGPRPWCTVDRLIDTIDCRTFRTARAVAPWSQWAADSVINDYGVGNVVVTPPGVELDVPTRQWGDSVNGLARVIYIGNDWRRKGGARLVAWHQQSLPNVELHLVGGDIPAISGPRIVRHGAMPRDQLLDLLSTMDVLCLPTKLDMSPLVIAEAAAAGVPVIATRLGGISELVQHQRTGVLCGYDDDRGWLTALERLTSNPTLRANYGRQARRFAEANLDCRKAYEPILAAHFG